MRGLMASAYHAAHPKRALAVRGGAMRTFVGLAVCLTLSLLCLGVYLIWDQFVEPLAPHETGLFTAAFLLATAMTLLYELIQLPRSVWRHALFGHMALIPRNARAGGMAPRTAPVYTQRRQPQCELYAHLPYQRCYVDRVRVRA